MNRINLWIALLLVSVLINGVLIGMVAKRGFDPHESQRHDQAEHAERAYAGPFEPRRFLRALPDEYRDEVRQQMRDARPEIEPLFVQVRETRRAVHIAMAAEPFDPVAVTQALDEARQARDHLERRSEAFMLDVAARLPADVRHQVLVEASVRRGERFRRREGPAGPHAPRDEAHTPPGHP